MASGEFEMRRSLPVLFIAVLAILLSACTQITYVNWDDLFPEENERKLSADELLERLDIPGIIEIAAGSGKVPEGISITPASGASITASRTDSVLTARIISFDEYKANGITVVSGSLRVSFLGNDSSVDSFTFMIEKDLVITSGDSNQYSYNVATEKEVTGKISATFDNGTLKDGEGAVIDFSSSLIVDNKVVQADGAKGDGSQRNPYVFTTASQLFSFAAAYNSGDIASENEYIYAELGADINLGEKQWTPIGTTTRSGDEFKEGERAFRGSFDGNGHSITGFSINNDNFKEDDGIGLFSAITGENTIVKGVRIQGTISSASNGSAGFISGLLADKATIDHCIVLAGSSIKTDEAGGIVGRLLKSGTVSNSENNASVTATGGKAAGIANSAYYDQFPGVVSNRDGYAEFTITGCTNNGAIKGEGYTGGIVGLAGGAVTVENCENTATVEGSDSTSVGGIVGELIHGASVIGCINRGDVNNTGSATGGLVGWIRYNNSTNYNISLVCSVIDSHNYGDVSCDSYGVGGAIGLIYWAGDISGCSSEGTVTTGTGNMAGGFCGGVQYLSTDNDDDSTTGPTTKIPDANYNENRKNGINFTDCHSDKAILDNKGNGSVVGTFIGHGVDCEIEEYKDIVTTFTGCTPTGEGSGIKD